MQDAEGDCVSDRDQDVQSLLANVSVGGFVLWTEKATEGIGTGK